MPGPRPCRAAFFLRKLVNDWREARTVATPNGVVTIAPHFMAQGIIDVMVQQKRAPASIRAAYDLAGADAVTKLIPHLGFSFPGPDWFAWMKAAMNRHEDGPSAA